MKFNETKARKKIIRIQLRKINTKSDSINLGSKAPDIRKKDRQHEKVYKLNPKKIARMEKLNYQHKHKSEK